MKGTSKPGNMYFFNKMFCKPREMTKKKKKKKKKKRKRFHPIWFPPSLDDCSLFYVHLFNNSALFQKRYIFKIG
jgi:hypothetical protein